jgi:flagellar biogenesis protein FliO
MRGRWLNFGLWSLLLLVPATGWAQEPARSETASSPKGVSRNQIGVEVGAEDEPGFVNSNGPLKLTRPEKSVENSGTRTDKPLSKQSSWTTSAGSLIVVLALIVGCGYLLKKQRALGSGILGDDIVQVLGRKTLDQRTTLQLIRCGSKILVISNSAQHGIRTLSEITNAAEVEAITSQCLQPLSLPGAASGNGPASANSSRSPLLAAGKNPPTSNHGGNPHA